MPGADTGAGKTARVRRGASQIIGWCELVDLADIGLHAVRAKMDSGAATSSLHADTIETLERDGAPFIAFTVTPAAGASTVYCMAPLIGYRAVRSSNGARQTRPVIQTSIKLGSLTWLGQLTLANRGQMRFPLLIGRRALRRGFVVDSARLWTLGKP